jgi:hypothetical protein
MARGSHKGSPMQNNTANLPSIPLDNLGAVTGGYLDHDPPHPRPDHERQGTSGSQQKPPPPPIGGILGAAGAGILRHAKRPR